MVRIAARALVSAFVLLVSVGVMMLPLLMLGLQHRM